MNKDKEALCEEALHELSTYFQDMVNEKICPCLNSARALAHLPSFHFTYDVSANSHPYFSYLCS